jgi:hypothetical protein
MADARGAGDGPARNEPRPGIADRVRLFGLLSGAWLAQACYAVAKLGVPDLLAEGPRSVHELAVLTETNEQALGRVLRAACSAGLLQPAGQETYRLAPMGQLLRAGVPRSSHDAAIMFGEEVFASFAEIGYTVRTGKPAFEKVYGQPFYDYLADHPQAAQTFSCAMGNGPVPAVLATCDLTGLRRVVDVGGGNGGLLSKVLQAHPDATGVLVDLPPSVADARERLRTAGLDGRVEFVAGSFFDEVPSGADVYVLSRVLHNWPDADAIRLLQVVRAAIPPDGRLLVFESLIEAADDGRDLTGVGESGPAAHAIDLLILLMLPGRDRTLAQYTDLLGQAGFAVRAVRPGPLRARQAESVIEAVPR